MLEQVPFHELTVDRLARAAGMSRSAVYIYFRDKHQLLEVALEQAAAELSAEADRWWGQEGEPRTLIELALGGVVRAYRRHALLLRVATEAATYDERLREFWRSVIERFIERTAAHLSAERARGRVAAELDPRATAESLVWMVERCCYVYLGGRERDPAELLEMLVPLWTRALYPVSARVPEVGLASAPRPG